MKIRKALLADAREILDIYAPYIENTNISFELEAPEIEAFTARIKNISSSYPYLVCEVDGKIAGYAYASQHHERAAYRYCADVAVYVHGAYQRRGIGRALYEKLFEMLREQGIYTVLAVVVVPNAKSVALHKALGFREAGVFHNVGYKFGEWLDVVWLEKSLRAYDVPKEIGR